MSRILVFSPYEPPPDGIANHSSHLVAAWDSAGHSVLVVSAKGARGLTQSEPIGPHSTLLRSLQMFSNRRAHNEIIKFSPDVVIVQFAIAAIGMNIWALKRLCDRLRSEGVRVVVAFHEPAREFNMLGFITRAMYRTVSRITDVPVVFSSAGTYALRDTGLFGDAVEVAHGTTGIESISDRQLDEVRDRYDIRKPLILTLGFTSFDKGADIFIKAAEFVSKNRQGEVQFIVAGAPRRRRGLFRIMERRDINWSRQLKTQFEALSNVDLSFCDYVPNENVAALLRLADVVVLPYRRITQSGVANLALSSQAVVVSSDLPGLRNDLGDAAVYVAVGDVEELAKEITNLIDEIGKEDRSRMRHVAGQRATERSFAIVAERLVSVGLASPLPDATPKSEG